MSTNTKALKGLIINSNSTKINDTNMESRKQYEGQHNEDMKKLIIGNGENIGIGEKTEQDISIKQFLPRGIYNTTKEVSEKETPKLIEHIKYLSTLGKDILSSLRRYARGYDGHINTLLRRKPKTSVELNKIIEEFRSNEYLQKQLVGYTNNEFKNFILDQIDNIDKAFFDAPDLIVPELKTEEAAPATVRRRGKCPKPVVEKMVKVPAPILRVFRGQTGEIITGDSYISTSYDIYRALSFTGNDCCLYILDIMPGVKVLPIKNISPFYENELLIERGCKLEQKGDPFKVNMTKEVFNGIITVRNEVTMNVYVYTVNPPCVGSE